MARFEQEYCIAGCTNRFGDGCKIPTKLERVANFGKAISDSARAGVLGVYPSTMVGGEWAVDFDNETRVCADTRRAAEERTTPEMLGAVVIPFPGEYEG